MRRGAYLVAILIFLLGFVTGCGQATPSWQEHVPVDVLDAPYQAAVERMVPIVWSVKGGEFLLTQRAEYKLAGRIVSKKSYFFDGWRTQIAPYDLAMIWGDLVLQENRKWVSFSQSGRWYWYNWKAGTPYPESFIVQHSSNTHVIPANKNIEKAIAGLRPEQDVRLEGYLVDADGSINGRRYWWHTSLSRADTGDASCEVFYVERITVNEQTYQ